MSAETGFDVIVVGAGPGGSSCAALLAHRGLRVLLLDKNPRAGGRMTRLEKDGFAYEPFPINGVPARSSRYEAILAELGLEREIEIIRPSPPGVMCFGLPSGEIHRMEIADSAASGIRFLRFLGLKPSQLVPSLRLMRDLLTLKGDALAALDDVTLEEYLRPHSPAPNLYAFLGTLAEGMLETPVDLACASEFIRIYQQSALRGSGRYIAGGYGRMFDAFARSVESHGGRSIASLPVDRILVRDGEARGVMAGGRRYDAPIVVSNASIPTTVLGLVGGEHFDTSYVNWVRGLHPGWGYAGYRAILSRPVFRHYTNIYFSHKTVITSAQWAAAYRGEIPEEAYVFVGTNSVYPGMAPAGRQLVYMGMTCPSDPGLDIAPYLDRVRTVVGRVWPDVFPAVESLEPYGPGSVPPYGSAQVLPGQGGEVYGLAQTVGQCGRHKPGAAAPVLGLYYVGFSTGHGLGTNAAADSALLVAGLVERHHRTRLTARP